MVIKRLALFLVLFFVSVSVISYSTVSRAQSSPILVDNFDDNAIDSTLWSAGATGGLTVNETNQRMEIELPSTSAGAAFGGGYSSAFQLTGDFDIEVEYLLLTWPPNNGVRVGLGIQTTSGSRAAGERVSDFGGEVYLTHFSDGVRAITPTTDVVGKLRLTRIGSVLFGFYSAGGSWVPLHSAVISLEEVTVSLSAWSHDGIFSNQPVLVAFDNFTVNQGEVIGMPIWQIGTFDGDVGAMNGSHEFLSNSDFVDTHNYNVDSDPDNEEFSPRVPGYLDSQLNPGAFPRSGARVINIEFFLDQDYGNTHVLFSRYGTETNDVLLDGTLVESTIGPGENINGVYLIETGYLSLGSHTLTLRYAEGGVNSGNHIDALRLSGLPAPPENCDQPTYYGVQHCVYGNDEGQVLRIEPDKVRFETVMARGYAPPSTMKQECRDVNIPQNSTGPGCQDQLPGLGVSEKYPVELVGVMAERLGAIAAFNGDYFDHIYHNHGPEGLTVKNGERFDGWRVGDCDTGPFPVTPCYGNDVNRSSLAISLSNHVEIGRKSIADVDNPASYAERFYNVVGGLPLLVHNGDPVNLDLQCAEEWGSCPDPDNNRGRTAVGITGNGELIVVTIPDTASEGVTLERLAEIMDELGAIEAINLDGGGSSQLWYDGNYLVGSSSGRAVANSMVVFAERIQPPNGLISGSVFVNNSTNPLPGSFVQVCESGRFCKNTQTNSLGQYTLDQLAAGQYIITVFPPAGSNLEPGTLGPLTLPADGELINQDIILIGPAPLPPGTAINYRRIGANGVPVVHWQDELGLVTQGCPDGAASYQIVQDGSVIRNGIMSEGLSGVYTAAVPQLHPSHGYARVIISILCPDSSTTTISFDIYIDPSGIVQTVDGTPIEGATVTLLRADNSGGPFSLVPDGSAFMSPENRNNPDLTDANGLFGWNVLGGFYIVRAEKEGCVSATNASQSFVETGVMIIPPPVTDLDLRLECPPVNVPPVAKAGGPYEGYEGVSVSLDGSGSSDPDENIVLYEWDLDNDGEFDDATGVAAQVTYGNNGLYTVGLKVTDEYGEYDTDTATVTVNNMPPVVSIDVLTQTVQYSDYIHTVTITGTDVATDTMTASTSYSVDGGGFVGGLPAGMVISDASCGITDGTNTCTWTLSGTTGVPEGLYTIRVTVDDDDGGSTSVDTDVKVQSEDASAAFDPNNPVGVQVATEGGDSGQFFLTVVVSETILDLSLYGSAPGDIGYADVTFLLAPVGPGSPVNPVGCSEIVAGTGYNMNKTVTCEFNGVSVNTYVFQVAVKGGYYTGYNEDVVTVFDPSLGFATGGGWFYWPDTDEKTNFGFTMRYNKKGNRVKGSFLLIRHLEDGTIYRVKSNALFGLAVGDEDGPPPLGWASFSGKATYQEPDWADPIGNYRFITYTEDRNEPGNGYDQIWIEIWDQNGDIVDVMSMPRGAIDNTVPLDGGNIAIPHDGG